MPQSEIDYIPYHAETRVGRGRVLVFAPHPDDEVFGCAGAILQHAADGDEVRVIIATDGAFGGGEDPRHYASTRQAESREAGKILGYGTPIFWGLPDRGLLVDSDLVARIETILAEYRPALVYAPSWWEIHPDHTALSLAVTETLARVSLEAQLILYEVGVPLHPNLLLDISAHLSTKQAAMACFASQMAQQAYGDHLLALNRFRTYTLPQTVRAAEAYRRVNSLTPLPSAPLMSRCDQLFMDGVQFDPAAKHSPSYWARIWQRLIRCCSAVWNRDVGCRSGLVKSSEKQ
jgi:LmbE family N-acetylglucosaminyl deacetylase